MLDLSKDLKTLKQEGYKIVYNNKIPKTNKEIERLITENRGLVYHILRKWIASGKISAKLIELLGSEEDVISEGMYCLIKAANTYNTNYTLSAYLTKILNNHFNIIYRDLNCKKRQPELLIDTRSISENTEGEQMIDVIANDSQSCLDNNFFNIELLSILSLLNEEEIRYFKYMWNKLTQHQIAAIEHLSQPNVGKKINKLKNKLKIIYLNNEGGN